MEMQRVKGKFMQSKAAACVLKSFADTYLSV